MTVTYSFIFRESVRLVRFVTFEDWNLRRVNLEVLLVELVVN